MSVIAKSIDLDVRIEIGLSPGILDLSKVDLRAMVLSAIQAGAYHVHDVAFKRLNHTLVGSFYEVAE